MYLYHITKLNFRKKFLTPTLILAHTTTCPTVTKSQVQQTPVCKPVKCPVCPGTPGSPGGTTTGLKRALRSGKVRMGFIPEEWFLFFHSKTGVSGPYIFGIVVANYLFSKEIYVMEHEYYTGLSVFPMMYYISTKLGPDLARILDKDVDNIVNKLENGRKAEMSVHEKTIEEAKDAQWRAEGQKLLMDAKKENIAMQLEAAYRERYMQVYHVVKGRLDYQVKMRRALSRIHQKWMIKWIIENVKKSITPEFEKRVFEKAIQDISAIAGRA